MLSKKEILQRIVLLIIFLPAVLCTYMVYRILKKHIKEEKLEALIFATLMTTGIVWLSFIRELLF